MLNQDKRMTEIVQYIKENKYITLEIICKLCGISRYTARKDLLSLEKRGILTRTHGGAVLPILNKEVKCYKDRLKSYSNEKKIIGKMAAALIKNGKKIILDSSTTVEACVEFINEKNCYIITNSINLAELVIEIENTDIFLLGGKINKEHRYLYGPSTIAELSNYCVDKAFIGTVGISEDGLTVAQEEDGHVVKKMIKQSNQVIVLADHSKFGRKGFFKCADISDIDVIITDKLPDKDLMEIFYYNRVEVMVAEIE
ncbi:transcriptional regulator, DeoR family [Clostridium acidisoli DSM 12555]|uniref:Transcriptional regulator, DeoR family n=1 Tax=Clostridium acidisoli DSM 12555 TaxID=1121291 RepID=A0A1W1XKU0_9CLOT|nr:DeoR/GlpR family DNA-binding transcription regulator [Clostridium acidisoli]SMC24535.1 transcriptional regulator, DeoR family [Clostridium acidisoli DSM 12555]